MQGGINREKIPQGEELSVTFHYSDYTAMILARLVTSKEKKT